MYKSMGDEINTTSVVSLSVQLSDVGMREIHLQFLSLCPVIRFPCRLLDDIVDSDEQEW